MFLIFLSWAGLGMSPAYFVLPALPLRVGGGLCNRAPQFVARDAFPELWPGFRWFLASSVFVSFTFYRPPPTRDGGDLHNIDITYSNTGE